MPRKKKLSNFFVPPRDKANYSRPEGAGNFDNMDDFNIVNSSQTNENISEAFLVRLIAGENLSKGNVVMASRTADLTVVKAGVTDGAAGRDQPIGVVYNETLSGQNVLIVFSGKANVLSDGSVVHGDFINCSGTTSGTITAAPTPTVPADASHWREVGHAIQSRTGAGLFKAILHFN